MLIETVYFPWMEKLMCQILKCKLSLLSCVFAYISLCCNKWILFRQHNETWKYFTRYENNVPRWFSPCVSGLESDSQMRESHVERRALRLGAQELKLDMEYLYFITIFSVNSALQSEKQSETRMERSKMRIHLINCFIYIYKISCQKTAKKSHEVFREAICLAYLFFFDIRFFEISNAIKR